MKALSLLHKQGCPFMRAHSEAEFTRRNACAGWVFPIERNTFDSACCPPGMIRGVIIKLPRMRDVTENGPLNSVS